MEIVKDIAALHEAVFPARFGLELTQYYKTMMQELVARTDTAWAITANQLEIPLRAFVMKLDTVTNIFIVNPEIIKQVGECVDIEGCLSLPGKRFSVKRPKKIVVRGFNEKWQPVKYKLHDTSARVVCHEVDHLDGILISDKNEEKLA